MGELMLDGNAIAGLLVCGAFAEPSDGLEASGGSEAFGLDRSRLVSEPHERLGHGLDERVGPHVKKPGCSAGLGATSASISASTRRA